MSVTRQLRALLFSALAPLAVSGQTPVAPYSDRFPNCGNSARQTYLLGPDDQIEISGTDLTEFASKPARIDGDGNVQAPLVGRIHVAGLTAPQAEQVLDRALSAYIRDPRVAVSVTEIRSQPVTVLGAVNNPGVQQVQGYKTLLEMLSLAGGIRQDAGYSIRVTRQVSWGCIPIQGATLDPSKQFIVAELDLKALLEAKDPTKNVQIVPHDVITVPKAELIYVVGEVKRSGGFVLGARQTMSVLQALSLTEGLNADADARHAKILRLKSDSDQREEIAVDIKQLFKGKVPDVQMRADDILFVPGSAGQRAFRRTLEAAIQAGTGLAIWRVP